MDLSDFKPPVRLSMSDEEIYQALGAAQATEDGLAKAMAIVEEQANLREHDNQVFNEWVVRMQNDPRPEAKIALENVERVKQGLEPLSLEVQPEPEPSIEPVFEPVMEPVFEPVVEEVVEIEIEPIPEPVQEPELEEDAFAEFEALLEDAATEATSAIDLATEQPVLPAVTNFEVAPEEDALVTEAEIDSPKPASGWWGSAAFWVVALGVLVPTVAAALTAEAGMSFGTAIAGFGLGLLVNLGFIVAGHFTRQRSESDLVVTRRASFGVFGAILPGLVGVFGSLGLLVALSLASVKSFDGAFAIDLDFGQSLFGNATVGLVISATLVIVAFAVAKFANRWLKIVNAVSGALLVIAFTVAALLTRSRISFEAIDLSIDFGKAIAVASGVSVVGAFAYSSAAKVVGTKGKLNTVSRWAAIVFAAVLLPLAVFAHFQLVYAQNPPADSFSLLDIFGRLESPNIVSPILWVLVLSVVVLGGDIAAAAISEVKSFAVNKVNLWVVGLLAGVALAGVYLEPDFGFWAGLFPIVQYPLLAVVGFAVADSLLRRGSYHEASLQRSYGFYGSVNYLGVAGLVLASAAGYAVSPSTSAQIWLGFAGWTTELAPAISFAVGVVWVFVTGIPRILVQQKEVLEVDSRKASLNSFTGFSE